MINLADLLLHLMLWKWFNINKYERSSYILPLEIALFLLHLQISYAITRDQVQGKKRWDGGGGADKLEEGTIQANYPNVIKSSYPTFFPILTWKPRIWK